VYQTASDVYVRKPSAVSRFLRPKPILIVVAIVALLPVLEMLRNQSASGFSTGSYGENRGPQLQRSVSLLPPLSSEPGVFRFGSFNIHMARAADEKPAMTRMTSIVSGLDVIGLQEVGGGGWDGTENYAQTLARATGNRHWVVAPTKLRWFRPRGGNALVSDLPPESVSVIKLEGNRRDYRNIVETQFQIEGTAVRYFNTQLSHRYADMRDRQFDRVIEMFLSSKHAILVADLGMRADNPRMRKLLENPAVTDALGAIAQRAERPEIKPADDVDWILLHNLEPVDAGRLPPGISDHPMIWADIRVSPDA